MAFLYEKAHETDAGTPDKISMITTSRKFSREERKKFGSTFKNLLSHRDKGYISLRLVQSQLI